MDMTDDQDTMQGETGMDNGSNRSDQNSSDDQEPTSVFLPKSALGGQTVKPGQTLTLKVEDVDPETGDVQAVCQYDDSEPDSGDTMESEFDKAMPSDQQS